MSLLLWYGLICFYRKGLFLKNKRKRVVVWAQDFMSYFLSIGLLKKKEREYGFFFL